MRRGSPYYGGGFTVRMINWADVTNHVSALSDYNLAAQTDVLNFVNTTQNVASLGGKDHPRTRLAQIYLAAHFATLDTDLAGAGGPVTAESLGSESRSYGSFAMDSTSLSVTSYGLAYLSLVRTSPCRGPILL